MKLTNFTIIVTDDCNKSCSYCPQTREKKTISLETLHSALNFFHPFMEDGAVLSFYGGEPLLEFELIKEVVEWINRHSQLLNSDKKSKHINFSITTNGSLLTPPILEFFNQNRFSLLLSYDGLAQEITRGKNDIDTWTELFKSIDNNYPDIKFKTNSIFTPQTLPLLADSVQFLSALGVRNKFALSKTNDWNTVDLAEYQIQFNAVAEAAYSDYIMNGTTLVDNFKGITSPPTEGLFACSACKNRMAISPEGYLWGCFLFHDYFKQKEKTDEFEKYSLGHLEDFIPNHNTLWLEKCSNYSRLRIDNFWTDSTYCFSCDKVYQCNICPIAAAYSSHEAGELGYIPPHLCKINKITNRIKENLFQRIQHRID
jgi:uncharacterized protein